MGSAFLAIPSWRHHDNGNPILGGTAALAARGSPGSRVASSCPPDLALVDHNDLAAVLLPYSPIVQTPFVVTLDLLLALVQGRWESLLFGPTHRKKSPFQVV
jgi:hypothetical protein